VADARAAIDARIRAYPNLLLGVRGLSSSDAVSRDEVQGYFFGRPMPAQEFAAVLKAGPGAAEPG